ncbi:MAG: phosphoenolpyruvate synthase, partial [Candidatus Aenigmarchaeota archaeon]|nr:phosphoenolpyruvate synthase [Candidatus Aenigmarchaeota archaeon]
MDIVWFKDLGKGDVAVAGGKGANLGEMTRAGLPVPPGFVITSNAYNKFLKEGGIEEKIMEILGNTNVDNSAELQNSSEEIRKLVMSTGMPSSIRGDILKHYKALCKKKKKKEEF